MHKKLKTFLGLMVFLLLFQSVAAARIGIGTFWGKNLPVVQEDASLDKLYGFKLILIPLSFMALEPNFTYSGMGEATLNVGGAVMTRDGGQIKSWGVDLLLGNLSSRFFHLYLVGGLNTSTLQKESLPDQNRTAFDAGLGLEFTPLTRLGIEAQVKALMIPLEGGGAKDNLGISGGINFYLGK